MSRTDQIMWGQLFKLSASSEVSLQRQLREMIVCAILDGHIGAEAPMPSSRELAKQLGIARNTVVLAYQHLVDEGYLVARERSGYYTNPDMLAGRVARQAPAEREPEQSRDHPDWAGRFKARPSRQRNIEKPPDWQKYEYPFIYGQLDPKQFPLNDWRECARQALSVSEVKSLVRDRLDADDPLIVEQIQTRVLPRRGVWASRDEILMTLGAQNALYLLAELLVTGRTTVGFEDPGYPDARNILSMKTPRLAGLPVDEQGLVIDGRLDDCDYVFVTPGHQSPTTVTLSPERRRALLARAEKSGFIIIEDDYESEINYLGDPTPALKSLDDHGRVLYVGSLSKTLDPGLRIGYLVGPADLIREARALRRLMLRHPPSNNQRSVALFLSLGHHDSLIQRLSHAYKDRWHVMGEALAAHLPGSFHMPTFGGTSYWVRGPEGLDARELAREAAERGIFIEPGDINFMSEDRPLNYFRLGFSSIAVDRIEPGIRKLAGLIDELVRGRRPD